MAGHCTRASARLAALPAFCGAAAPAAAQPYDGMGMWHGSWGWGHMAAGGLLMLLFWGALIALLVLLVRTIAGRGTAERGTPLPGPNALDVLEERFARGEINQQEFAERRRVLLAGRAERQGRSR